MSKPIGLGVIGLGRAFTLMLPTWLGDPRVRLIAGYDPREHARQAFTQQLGGAACPDAEAVCVHPHVEWVYVASPHGLHVEHVLLAARHGKHVLVEKPMAITLADAQTMIDASEQACTHLIVGHSHSFDAPVLQARDMIDSGNWGRVRMIQSLQYTDFLYRPRRPEELQTALGGGVVFSQAAHQIDVIRLLAGGMARTVRAITGRWDPARPTEGAYSALMTFDEGVWASLTYNGYGRFDSDLWMNGIGELGMPKNPLAHSKTLERYQDTVDEAAEAEAKAQRNFGGRHDPGLPRQTPLHHQHFGPVIVSCDRADLQLTPSGLVVHDRHGVHMHELPAPSVPRQDVVDEIWAVGREGRPALHHGRWSMATLEACLAILESAANGRDIILDHQVSAAY